MATAVVRDRRLEVLGGRRRRPYVRRMDTTDLTPPTEYGIVREDAALDHEHEDELVRHVTEDLERATFQSIDALSKGVKSAVAFRPQGGEWLTLYSRQSPSAWIRTRLEARNA